jgi:hypothetical protein
MSDSERAVSDAEARKAKDTEDFNKKKADNDQEIADIKNKIAQENAAFGAQRTQIINNQNALGPTPNHPGSSSVPSV